MRCQVVAPADGVIEHANDKQRINAPLAIVAGGTVRERQIIAHVHDVAGPMEVNAKVSAAFIKKVKRGMKARLKIEALPGERLSSLTLLG